MPQWGEVTYLPMIDNWLDIHLHFISKNASQCALLIFKCPEATGNLVERESSKILESVDTGLAKRIAFLNGMYVEKKQIEKETKSSFSQQIEMLTALHELPKFEHDSDENVEPLDLQQVRQQEFTEASRSLQLYLVLRFLTCIAENDLDLSLFVTRQLSSTKKQALVIKLLSNKESKDTEIAFKICQRENLNSLKLKIALAFISRGNTRKAFKIVDKYKEISKEDEIVYRVIYAEFIKLNEFEYARKMLARLPTLADTSSDVDNPQSSIFAEIEKMKKELEIMNKNSFLISEALASFNSHIADLKPVLSQPVGQQSSNFEKTEGVSQNNHNPETSEFNNGFECGKRFVTSLWEKFLLFRMASILSLGLVPLVTFILGSIFRPNSYK